MADQVKGADFAWVKTSQKLFYSCYCIPNCTIQDFDLFLSGLEASIRNQTTQETDLIVAGDFNSHSAE